MTKEKSTIPELARIINEIIKERPGLNPRNMDFNFLSDAPFFYHLTLQKELDRRGILAYLISGPSYVLASPGDEVNQVPRPNHSLRLDDDPLYVDLFYHQLFPGSIGHSLMPLVLIETAQGIRQIFEKALQAGLPNRLGNSTRMDDFISQSYTNARENSKSIHAPRIPSLCGGEF